MAVDGSANRRRRVLVVDDEDGILRTFRRILEPVYEVVTEASPEAALALMKDGAPFDAIVCDVRMPVMTGPALRDAIAQQRSSIASRFLFVSATPPDASLLAGAPVLSKPVKRAELLEAVARVIDARTSASSWTAAARISGAPQDH
jgi:CheY-like chemotaxis protein